MVGAGGTLLGGGAFEGGLRFRKLSPVVVLLPVPHVDTKSGSGGGGFLNGGPDSTFLFSRTIIPLSLLGTFVECWYGGGRGGG